MKKSNSSKLALSMALGLLASTAVTTAAMAADTTQGLFGLNEVSQPIQIAKGEAHKCGAGSCGAKSEKSCGGKEGDKHCGKEHKHAKGEKACGGKEGNKHCGSDHKHAKGEKACGGKGEKGCGSKGEKKCGH